jgi:hypothetical protein
MLIQTLGTTDFTTTPSSRPHLPWVPPAMLRDAMKCTTLKAFFTLIIDQESDDAIKSSYDAAAATAAARSVFATSTGLSGHQHHRARCHSISDEMGHHQYTLTPNARCSRGVQPLHQSDLTMTSEITTTPQSAILLTNLRAQTAAATRTGALITAAT